MAARKITAVGSLAWLANERQTIKQLEEQDVEDIAYAVRNDMDWLNEHMANIFEKNIFDMAEIMKTPGRLRLKTPGKTPRTLLRRPFVNPDEEQHSDIFNSRPAATPFANRLQKPIPASAKKQSAPPPPTQPTFIPPTQLELPTPDSPHQLSPTRSPTRTSPRKQPSPTKVDTPVKSPIKDIVIQPPTSPGADRISRQAPPNFGDSGFFTSSNPNSQAEASQNRPRDSTISQLSVDTNARRHSEFNDGRNSFSTAKEDVSMHPPSSPVEEVILLGANPPELSAEREPSEETDDDDEEEEEEEDEEEDEQPELYHETPIRPPPLSTMNIKASPLEPRRSGRLAVTTTASEPREQAPPVPEAVPSPPRETRGASMTDVDEPASPTEPMEDIAVYPVLPAVKSKAPEPEPIEPEPIEQETMEVEAMEPEATKPETLEPEAMQIERILETPSQSCNMVESETPSEPPTPDIPAMRKSSMSFASLPAREPLTSKKSMGAKAIRESQLEQLKQDGAQQRASWKKSNGKSLGGSSRSIIRKTQEEENEEEEGTTEPKTGEKRKSNDAGSSRYRKISRGADLVGVVVQETTKIPTKSGDDGSDSEIRNHSKASTQRLHDKIQLLGKHSARTARSFPATAAHAHIGYPDLSEHDQDGSATQKEKTHPGVDEAGETVRVKSQFPRSKTEGAVFGVAPEEPIKPVSPRRLAPLKTRTPASPSVNRTVDLAIIDKPGQSSSRPALSPTSPMKTVTYASIADVPQFAANSGASSTKKTPSADTTLSAVKAQTSNMIKKAKEMWMKSASSSDKPEPVGSPPPPLRKWQGAESLQDIFKRDASPIVSQDQPKARQESYPDLGSVLSSSVGKVIEREEFTAPSLSVVETLREEGRQTRNSRSRTAEAAKTATPTPTIEDADPEAMPVSPGRQTRNSRPKEDAHLEDASPRSTKSPAPRKAKKSIVDPAAEEERKKRLAEIYKQAQADKERMERQKEEEQRKLKEPSPMVSEEEEEPVPSEPSRSRYGSAEAERPTSRLQQRGLRFQKLEPKRTVRTAAKEQPTVKPAPIPMKISTASQREMHDQRLKGTTSSAIVSALKSTFEASQPPPPVQQPTLHTSSSNGSLRSLASTGITKQVRSLQSAASQRKKEQEEKDKKRREQERRRAENQRKQDEEQKRIQALRQKATTPGLVPTAKPGARAQGQNPRPISQEPETTRVVKPYGSLNKNPYGQGSIKRTHPQDMEEPQSRHVPSRPGTAASYHQDGPKKRRTNDYEDRAYEMPPPIRASMVKKDIGSKGLAHGYVQAAATAVASSTMKAPGSRVPQIEAVKFSKEKINFAGGTPGPSSSSGAGFKTPGTKVNSLKSKTPAFKESPLYQPGESIVLPDIPTDSEDEDDDYPKKNDFSVPQWAESPELRDLLRQQQAVDPASIFGPMAKLDMEAIFKNEAKTGRFRARTSSANWGGADRLTQAEIIADQEARRKMMETGKWVPSGL